MTQPPFPPLLALAVALACSPAMGQPARYPVALAGPPLGPSQPALAIAIGASPELLLLAARGAVQRGKLGEAEETLERAQTRLLDRQVAPAALPEPDRQPIILDITAARHALVLRDRAATMGAIYEALRKLASAAQRRSIAAAGPDRTPPPFQRPNGPEPFARPMAPQMPPSIEPTTTYAQLPGHWQLDGARWVWVSPETTLRPVVTRSLVPNQYAWKDGRWVFEPQHFGLPAQN